MEITTMGKLLILGNPKPRKRFKSEKGYFTPIWPNVNLTSVSHKCRHSWCAEGVTYTCTHLFFTINSNWVGFFHPEHNFLCNSTWLDNSLFQLMIGKSVNPSTYANHLWKQSDRFPSTTSATWRDASLISRQYLVVVTDCCFGYFWTHDVFRFAFTPSARR